MSPSLIKLGSDMQDQNPAIQPYRWFKTLPHAAVQLRDWPPFQKHKPCLCIAAFRPNISSTQVHFQFLQPKFSHAIIYLYNYIEYLLYMAANSASLTCVGSVPTFGFLNIHQETNEEAQNPNDTWQSTGVIWQPWGVPPQKTWYPVRHWEKTWQAGNSLNNGHRNGRTKVPNASWENGLHREVLGGSNT